MDNSSIFENAIEDIRAERCRQIHQEGWDEKHDDAHDRGQLADAAASYACGAPIVWPWSASWWKPGPDRRRELVKAGALIVAELERLERMKNDG